MMSSHCDSGGSTIPAEIGILQTNKLVCSCGINRGPCYDAMQAINIQASNHNQLDWCANYVRTQSLGSVHKV